MTGFICVNKGVGVSSAREVAIIKRLSGIPCGHMGTLDPMASGVLPVAIGNAARLFDYFLGKTKTYEAIFRFGEAYDTLDTTGEMTERGGRIPTAEEIEAVLPQFIGEIMQVPPKYSAKCIDGRRGYQLARAGVEFEIPAKKIKVHEIKLISKTDENSYSFRIVCGGGTYIRSLARDIAEKLDTVAAMSALVRTASGPFTIEKSVTTSELNKENLQNYLIACDGLLPYPHFKAEGETEKKLLNGVPCKCALADGDYALYVKNDCFYGIATVNGGLIKVRTKLC